MENRGGCFYCGVDCEDQCECGEWTCGMEHQLIHRPGKYCLPFKVCHSPEVGRYLVASRDIKPLELVLWDRAAAVGPGADALPVCLECFGKVDGSFLCPKCQFPLCGTKCVGKNMHKDECEIFAKLEKKPNFSNLTEKHPIYSTITPLRLILLKKKNRLLWDSLCTLMDHNTERFASDPEIAKMFKLIVDFFLEEIKLDFVSKEEIYHIIGVLLTNGFENDHEGVQGRAIYPNLSLASHACRANLRHAVSPGFQVALQAQVPIPKGTELTIRYTHMLQGHLKRRKQISEVWFFDCSCIRCCDPTENGSLASAVTCPGCETGVILPIDSLDIHSMWRCSGCRKETDPKYIMDLEERVDTELEDVEGMDIDGYVALLEKYKPLLPPTHYLMVIIKRYIQAIYGTKPGLELENMTLTQLEDKAKFCRSFIRYLGKLDPGYSQHLGLSTIELSKVQLEIARRKSSEGEIDKLELVRQMKENMALQNQAQKWIQVLQIEGRHLDVSVLSY